MKNSIKGILFFLAVLATSLQAEAAAFSAEWSVDHLFPGKYKVITLTARDNVTITGVSINRGNCKLAPAGWTKFPVRMGFGQAIRLKTYHSCNVLELQISTNDNMIHTVGWR